MATFNTGGKNAHTRLNLRDIARGLVDPGQQNSPDVVESMLRRLVAANPVLRDQRTYLSGHLLNLPPGVQPLNSDQQSAFALEAQTLASWGLSSLSGTLRSLIVKGDTAPDTLTLALSQTPEWKQRFSGNAERVKNGLPELSPGQYLQAEESYRQVLKSYGIPSGFYDTQAALAKYIGGDVSATELDARAKEAHDTYMAAPQYMKNLWNQYFGTKGDAIAGILDPKVATQIIQDRGLQVQIGGAAAAQGLHINQQRAQEFQQFGVTQTQAQKAYSQISASLPIDQQIANRFHQNFGQTQEENDLLLGQGAATRERQALYSDEEALFKGHAGADTNALGVARNF